MMIMRTLAYILGYREVVSKLADDTLSTLKDVLDDISHICSNNPTPGSETGIKTLSQTKNTMSDWASTGSKFNGLLKTYQSECLGKCIEGFSVARRGLSPVDTAVFEIENKSAIATVARCLPPSVEIAVLEGDSAGEIVPRHRPPPVEIAVLEEESAVEISTMSRQSC